jgi:putative tricarboxylic transport membrane protein
MAGSFADGAPEGAPYVSRRALEIWTAAAVALIGVIVSAESLSHDIGWNEAGPGSGYFPFRIGLLLIAVAAVQVTLSASLESRRTGPASLESRRTGPASLESRRTGPASLDSHASGPVIFVTREEFHRTLSVFWPTTALVAAMFLLGAYGPSAVYLAWMMRRHGGHGWLASAAYGVAVMAAFFLIFDVWFRVPLARGPW